MLVSKGDVYVYSDRHKGTEIIIGIPVNEKDYKEEEKRRSSPAEGGVRLESINNEPVNHLSSSELILLVEDNVELRQFLKDSLSQYYKIIEAGDGKSGLEQAKKTFPNLIISDVIMPGMNGINLCRAIKQDDETRHIPFIMLTAKSTLNSQIEGLDSGADYYFAKPLNMDLLLLTIRNVFNQGIKLKERYGREYQVEAMDLVHSEKEKEFMQRLLFIIESQLVNPDFDIEYLCSEIGMSRTKLYQKIKSISGQSIGDFIRAIRLNKAKEIMTGEDVSLTEVMYRIGIQTQFMQDLERK